MKLSPARMAPLAMLPLFLGLNGKRAIEKLLLHDHFDGQGMIGTTLIAFSGDPFTILELTAR